MVEVVWSKLALKLNEAYNYIRKESLQSAKKVRDEILNQTDKLRFDPEIHPIDKYRKNNDGSIRAF